MTDKKIESNRCRATSRTIDDWKDSICYDLAVDGETPEGMEALEFLDSLGSDDVKILNKLLLATFDVGVFEGRERQKYNELD
jgi:hypothetical protein